jgi:hypothetical protein
MDGSPCLPWLVEIQPLGEWPLRVVHVKGGIVEPDMGENYLALGGKVGHVDEVLRDPNSHERCAMNPNAHPAADLMEGPKGAQHPVRHCKRNLHAVTVLGVDAAARGAKEG